MNPKPHICITACRLYRCTGGIAVGYGICLRHAYENWERNRKMMESETIIELRHESTSAGQHL